MKEFYYLEVEEARTGHEWRDEGEYARWGKEHDVSPIALMRVTSNEHYDVFTTYEVKPGDKLYLVWIEYSDGDSFGSESGLVEYVNVYKNLADAIVVTEEFKKKFTGNEKFIDIQLTSGYNERINVAFLSYYFTNFTGIQYIELTVH